MPGTCLSLQRRLLQMEYEEEKRAFSEVADRIGVLRLSERGDAWYPVTPVRTFHNSLNKRVVELTREADSATDHNFEYGKPVMFFTASETGAKTRMLFNGTVSYVDGDRMVIEIPESATIPTGSDTEKPGIMLSFDETSYRVMFDALDRTAAPREDSANSATLYIHDVRHGRCCSHRSGSPTSTRIRKRVSTKCLRQKMWP